MNTSITLYQGVEVDNAVYLAAFSQENGLQSMLEQIVEQAQSEAEAVDKDMAVAKNRKALASLARTVASAKVAIDGKGKELTEEAKAKIKIVDNNRKLVRDTLDNLRDTIRQPVTDWEEAEAEKKRAVDTLIQQLEDLAQAQENGVRIPAATLHRRLHEYVEPNLQHENEAVRIKTEEVCNRLKEHIRSAEEYEAQQAEIARLKAEQAEKEKAEYEAKIAAEAAEKARVKAEAQARAEREAAERAKIEAELKAEAAEREKQAALAKLEAEKQAAAEAERQRILAEEQAKAEAEAKRAADINHRRTINREIYAVMLDCQIPEQAAQAFLLKLQNGEVPHLKVNY